MQITSLSQLKPGDRVVLYNKRFDSTNNAIFVSHDASPLKRAIGYFIFDRIGVTGDRQFAIWQHELNHGGCSIQFRCNAPKPVQFKEAFGRCFTGGKILLCGVDYEGGVREWNFTGLLADAVAQAVGFLQPFQEDGKKVQSQRVSIHAATVNGFEEILTITT